MRGEKKKETSFNRVNRRSWRKKDSSAFGACARRGKGGKSKSFYVTTLEEKRGGGERLISHDFLVPHGTNSLTLPSERERE